MNCIRYSYPRVRVCTLLIPNKVHTLLQTTYLEHTFPYLVYNQCIIHGWKSYNEKAYRPWPYIQISSTHLILKKREYRWLTVDSSLPHWLWLSTRALCVSDSLFPTWDGSTRMKCKHERHHLFPPRSNGRFAAPHGFLCSSSPSCLLA